MLIYITIGTNDVARATPFYDAVMGALGYERRFSSDTEIGFAAPGDRDSTVYISTPYDERPATVGNGSMPALVAPSRASVDGFHAAGLAHGGTDEGAPGLRPYRPNFYACYLRDPDGNKLSAVCLKPA